MTTDRLVDDATMQAALATRTPMTAVLLRRGPAYDDAASAPLQWEHARNMFRLLGDARLVHVSAVLDGTDVLGFAIATGAPEEVRAEIARDPGVAGGRLTAEVVTVMTFDGDRDAHLVAPR